jgi:melanoma-associated antigen p97
MSVCIVSAAHWCTINDLEFKKCQDLTSAILVHIQQGRNTTVGASTYHYSDVPTLICLAGNNRYDCMQKIFSGEADLMQVETGLSYTAGEYYNMVPLTAEKYQPG